MQITADGGPHRGGKESVIRLMNVAAPRSAALERFLATPPIIEALASIEFKPRGFDVFALVHESDRWAHEYPVRSQHDIVPPTLPPGQPLIQIPIQIAAVCRPLALVRVGRRAMARAESG